jgi:hypothetical protein
LRPRHVTMSSMRWDDFRPSSVRSIFRP